MKKVLIAATLAAIFSWWWQGEVAQAETQVLAAVVPTFEAFYKRAEGESVSRTADLEALVRQAERLAEKATERPCSIAMLYFARDVAGSRSVLSVRCGAWRKPHLSVSSPTATMMHMHSQKK